ncbi:hypothetical protein PINS_up016515 [Pythium insidiosum]|nr:hypothetical protein PINS_up016515 [Pythium insidiosum]
MHAKTLVLAAAATAAVFASQAQADCADQSIKCVGNGFEDYYNAGHCWSWLSCKPCVDPCSECNGRFGSDRITGYERWRYFGDGDGMWDHYGCNGH